MISWRNNFLVFLTLFFIGFFVHIQSLQMVPYGDDWRFIYNYFTHEEVSANFSPFPGILAYLAPYGPSIFTIGFLYQVFGSNYYIYYLIPLIFKILTAFIIFLILKNISLSLGHKKNNIIINFLPATLFLVGTTGIQAIDWAFHINVYISIFIFALGLLFQMEFYNSGSKINLLMSLFLALTSILFAPFRLLCVVLLVPLIDLILLSLSKVSHLFLIFLLKNIIFVTFIFVFFWIGLFGHNPEDIYSPFPITESVEQAISRPVLSIRTFLHWIGVTIWPAYPAGNANSYLIGMLFIALLLVAIYKYRGRHILVGVVLYFIPLFLMWMNTPVRGIDSGDRYLPLSFFGLAILIGIIYLYLTKLRNLFTIIFLSLSLIQAYSTIKIYTHWISTGRGYDFTIPAQEKIMNHFPNAIKEPKIIFLDFDDPSFQQSIEFGLGYRIAVLSKTKGLNYLPTPMSNKEKLVDVLKAKLKNEGIDQVLDNVYAFQLRNKFFSDVTESFREEIKLRLN